MPTLSNHPRAARTYVVVSLDAGGASSRVLPLGTVAARCRGAARALARLVHASVPAEHLRVLAAGSAPGDLVARALALDAA